MNRRESGPALDGDCLITVEHHGDNLILSLPPESDPNDLQMIAEYMFHKLGEAEVAALAVDCKDLNFVHSELLKMLFGAQDHARRLQKGFTLQNAYMNTEMRFLLELTGQQRAFSIDDWPNPQQP